MIFHLFVESNDIFRQFVIDMLRNVHDIAPRAAAGDWMSDNNFGIYGEIIQTAVLVQQTPDPGKRSQLMEKFRELEGEIRRQVRGVSFLTNLNQVYDAGPQQQSTRTLRGYPKVYTLTGSGVSVSTGTNLYKKTPVDPATLPDLVLRAFIPILAYRMALSTKANPESYTHLKNAWKIISNNQPTALGLWTNAKERRLIAALNDLIGIARGKIEQPIHHIVRHMVNSLKFMLNGTPVNREQSWVYDAIPFQQIDYPDEVKQRITQAIQALENSIR